MNHKNFLMEKLKKYKKQDIIITNHAQLQAIFRGISLDEIKENIINPERLYFARKQKAEKEWEKKYDCYFLDSKNQSQRYIITINNKCIICTVMKIKKRWQHLVEKNAEI